MDFSSRGNTKPTCYSLEPFFNDAFQAFSHCLSVTIDNPDYFIESSIALALIPLLRGGVAYILLCAKGTLKHTCLPLIPLFNDAFQAFSQYLLTLYTPFIAHLVIQCYSPYWVNSWMVVIKCTCLWWVQQQNLMELTTPTLWMWG